MAGTSRPGRWPLVGAASLLLLLVISVTASCMALAPYTACGLLALAPFLGWFVSCESSHVHDSNEMEDYVLFLAALWTSAVVLYAPDSLFAPVRGLWAAPMTIVLAFLSNVLSRSRHRRSLARAGDIKNNWPRRPESADGMGDAHIQACVEALREALRPIDLNLVPTLFNSLVRFPKVLSCEKAIYEIFEDKSLDREELSSLILEAPTSLLFYKVKDHASLARFWRSLEGLWSRKGPRSLTVPARTTYAFENRTNLIRLLCHVRLPDLNLRARAIVIDGLQRIRLSSPAAERALENVMLKTFGRDLMLLKNLCDSKGTHQSLHRLIFTDILTPSVRVEILHHFRCQAGLCESQLQGSKDKRCTLRKVLCDVDDTFICSGGHFPAGIDHRLQKMSIYPGAPAFLRHLDQSFGLWSDLQNLTGGRKLGNITFLSARPHVYKGYSENKTLGHFAQLRDEGKLHCMPTMLCGSLDSGLKFVWKDELEPMARKKFSNFEEYAQLYPEYAFVFVGDNGQADLRAAILMVEHFPEKLEAALIHLVQPAEMSSGFSLLAGLPADRRAKIAFFRNYAEAATVAMERGLFSQVALGQVLCSLRADFEACSFPDALARERMRLEVNESIQAAEAAAGAAARTCGRRDAATPATAGNVLLSSLFERLPAVQELAESTEVATPYGIGRIVGFRPSDGIYTVRLCGWRAVAHVHLAGLQPLLQRRFHFSPFRRREARASGGLCQSPRAAATPPPSPKLARCHHRQPPGDFSPGGSAQRLEPLPEHRGTRKLFSI